MYEHIENVKEQLLLISYNTYSYKHQESNIEQRNKVYLAYYSRKVTSVSSVTFSDTKIVVSL